ncbi:hypothetical protein FKC79_10020 [Enterobacter hormaechei]|nr:hypothetical protein FKC79_10020 [Enterobacter hormaechei]
MSNHCNYSLADYQPASRQRASKKLTYASFISSSVKSGSIPVVVKTACDWVKPIYLTDHDIDILDRQTKKNILTYNKAWQANCHTR